MGTSVFQPSFARGELSKRLRGQFGSDLYAKGLDRCENFRPTPQGSLLMRAGTQHVASSAAKPRLFPFRAADGSEYVIQATAAQVRLYDLATGTLVPTFTNRVANGGFDDASAWGTEGAGGTWEYADGTAKLPNTYPGSSFVIQSLTTAIGSYTLRFRHRGNGSLVARVIKMGDPATVYVEETFATAEHWQEKTIAVVTADAQITVIIATSGDAGDRFVDDVWLTTAAGADYAASPWTADQLAEVHHDSEPAKSRTVFTQEFAGVHVFTMAPWGAWELRAAKFQGAPGSWRAGNWPRRVEVGFQGRMILASTPEEPNAIWGSKSGVPFDFTTGVNASDGYVWTISLKGGINWIRGQKALLLGDEVLEHSARGSSGIITGQDIDVTDESAFGSAPVQALHLGDQVAFVSRDRRAVRVASYSQEASGWVSSALTFIAEHITAGGVAEIHFARSPDPTLFLVLATGDVVACTYDRAQEVLAWYRLPFGAQVASAAVADSAAGSELWLAVERTAGAWSIERLPLHEESDSFLDDSLEVVATGTALSGLDHLNGKVVSAVLTGSLDGQGDGTVALTGATVALGILVVPTAQTGERYAVGLPYRAKAVTLPRNVKSGKIRTSKIGVILNDSALPKLKGERAPERSPATPLDEATPLYSGKVEVSVLGWDGEGKITIEQDLPLRTEILALYSTTQMNEA